MSIAHELPVSESAFRSMNEKTDVRSLSYPILILPPIPEQIAANYDWMKFSKLVFCLSSGNGAMMERPNAAAAYTQLRSTVGAILTSSFSSSFFLFCHNAFALVNALGFRLFFLAPFLGRGSLFYGSITANSPFLFAGLVYLVCCGLWSTVLLYTSILFSWRWTPKPFFLTLSYSLLMSVTTNIFGISV